MFGDLTQRVLDRPLRGRIETRSRLVEDQEQQCRQNPTPVFPEVGREATQVVRVVPILVRCVGVADVGALMGVGQTDEGATVLNAIR